MVNQWKVVQFGLGPIGIEAAKLVMKKNNLQLVGGVDIAPEKVGRDLGELLNLNQNLNLQVSNDPANLFAEVKPDVVLHCTGSFLNRVEEQLRLCIEAGVSVVSSCEELFYPYHRDAAFCERIHAAAKHHDVTVMATGVNPGFSMDALALAMTSVCTEVEKIQVTRIVDASKRRQPLQKKVGAGLNADDFRKLVNDGKLGHIGLVESLLAVADKLEFDLDEVQESIDPKISDRTVETPYLKVSAGEVAGILHVARGLKNGDERIKLELQMYVGADEPMDCVQIEGNPPIHLKVAGGIFGDSATIARMVNAAPVVAEGAPGLKTVLDLPMPFCIR
ncbi:MAG: dihydrodipicolinate reductase [bacterium]